MGTPEKIATRTTVQDGGASRDRTDDLYNAIVALSQLSYGPGEARESRACALIRQSKAVANRDA